MNLMLACALDGNQQILLLAWALVPTENQDNWEFFLNHLKEAYPPCSTNGFVIISDRDKGLVPATEKVLPDIIHAKCCHHIKENPVSIIFFFKKKQTKVVEV
jgi:zinc finger SWIM domain-containing protein 3